MNIMGNRYVRLTKGLNDKGILIKEEEIFDKIDTEHDWYASVYYYNDEHKKQFDKTGSVKGIKDVLTNKLIFDLDSKQDIELARKDAIEIVARLKKQNIQDNSIQVYFSGNKGYTIVVELPKLMTPEEMTKIATRKIGWGIKTLDPSVYNASRVLRLPMTKHQDSKLYKIPVSINDLQTTPSDSIRNRATDLNSVPDELSFDTANPEEEFFNVPEEKKEKKKLEVVQTDTPKIDWTKKPHNWKKYRWALLQGYFKDGERHNALMVIAASCRALGYDKQTTYYMCKSALKKQAQLTGQDEFPKEELWKNIIEESVYSDSWEGGQYSPKSNEWLRQYCERMGIEDEKDTEEQPFVQITDMGSQFEDYARNFEQNIIKTGIKELDDNVMLCASTLNGLLGQPGAGKTSMALNYLRNTSLNGIDSMFFSMDMSLPIVYAKLVQKYTGLDFRDALDLYKTNPKQAAEINAMLKEEYKNVGFNFRTGLTVNDIKRGIQEREQITGKKVKLVVVDYLECIVSGYSDPTAGSGMVSNQLKDVATETGTCILQLLQTQKHSTPDISDPLLTLKAVKGSSVIEQSNSVILTLWREGYSPKHVDNDKYISFAVVKNRFGSLWSGDFSWEGLTGNIKSLTMEEKLELKKFKERKEKEKLDKIKKENGIVSEWE